MTALMILSLSFISIISIQRSQMYFQMSADQSKFKPSDPSYRLMQHQGKRI